MLTGGVRIITVPDLFAGSRYWSVLRSSHTAALHSEAFAIKQPYISGLYGSKYSIQAFEDYLRSIDPLLAFVSDLTDLSGGWTSDATDAAHQIGQEFRERVLKDFPEHKFVLSEGTYYCSDLVRVILNKVNLIPRQDKLTRITPSALFDLLLGYGFVDVTNSDFSSQAVEAVLAHSRPSAVKVRYDSAVNEAQFWSGDHVFKDIWDVVEKQHIRVLSDLDEMQKRLFRMMGIPPTKRKT